MRLLHAALLALVCSLPVAAHAFTFDRYSVIISGEGGARQNTWRLTDGTRRTPFGAAETSLNAEVVLFAPRYWPSRISLMGGVDPELGGTWNLPTAGRRPSLKDPLADPGVLKDISPGFAAHVGARYRLETGYAFVPFLEASILGRGSKAFSANPLHVNLALRAGGGMEWWPLHRVAIFGGVHLQGGPMLYPLIRMGAWPWVMPEASVELLTGIRVRVF